MKNNKKISLWNNEIPGYQSIQIIPSISLYLLENNKINPVIIIYPGGAYEHHASHEGEPVAHWLNRIGISAIVLNYRLSPAKHPYPMLDALRAIKLVRYNSKEWNIDPKRLGIMGFSAGGHLASTIATHFNEYNIDNDGIDRISSRPDLLILCYPVISFIQFVHERSMTNLIGESSSDELKYFLSTENHVSKETPPVFLWHTANDESVPVENSIIFAEALKINNVKFEMHIFAEGRHGLGIKDEVPQVAIWTKLCESWLRRFGF